VLVVVAALAAGACGGDGGGDGVGAGAEIAPASSAVFVSVANDPNGEQWQTAEELVGRFPSGRDAVAEFVEGLEEEGLDFERDVRPALGPEVDLVVLDIASAERGEGTVVLTQPPDEAKLEALVAKGDDVAYEMVDDWAVIAEDAAAIAAFEEARGDESLAETEAWRDATDDLPDDALVRGFVSGAALTSAAAAEGGGAGTSFLPGGGVASVGFAVRAEDEGVRLDAATPTPEEDAAEPYEASFPDELPAGALAYVSWSDAAERIRQGLRQAGDQNAEIDRYVAQAELALGVSLERDVLPLLEGEGALAVYASESEAATSGELPFASSAGVVLALAVEDDEQALATVDRIVERASALLGAIERTEDTEIAGAAVRTVSFEGGELLYAAFDGKLVLATAREPLEAVLANDGDALSDDAAYAEARDGADTPDETVGFAYVNVDAIVAAYAAGAPPDVRENLDPLGTLFVHASREDDETATEGFLAID
jgi:hypothetical protein